MKIAVSSYSFTQAINDGRMTMLDVIPKAKELGFDGIEIVRMNQTDDEMLALAEQLHAQSVELDFPIVAYMVGNDFLKESIEDCVARLTRELNIAKVLGAPAMRHDATAGVTADGKQLTFEEALPIIADGYRRVTEIAAEMGIRTMIENHGYFAQDALRVKKLVETVGHPNFGWLCDMGNFMCADEVSVESVKIAAPMAVHAHAKDFHWLSKDRYQPMDQGWFPTRDGNALRGAIIGHGEVNVPECLKILRAAGYDSWLSVEFEGIEDCLMALEADLANLKEMLG